MSGRTRGKQPSAATARRERAAADAAEHPAPRRRRLEDALARAKKAARESDWVAGARDAGEALRAAAGARDFPALADAAGIARGAWVKALQLAGKAKGVVEVRSLGDLGVRITETGAAVCDGLKNGRYLLCPPGCVGIDGRTLKDLCEQKGIAALVLVREPATRSGHWPLVAVGPVTVRARVDPPGAKAKPSAEWCVAALDALAAAALETVVAVDPFELVDELVERVETLPECVALYDPLIDACAKAEEARLIEEARPKAPKRKPPPRDDSDASE